MSKSVSLTVHISLLMVLLIGIGSATAQSEFSGSIPIDFGIEGLLRQFQRSYDNTVIDPDEYVIAPGDEFTIYFTANQIDDILCEVGAGGDLFVKSVGLIELGHITLREAYDRIGERVRAIYPKADFSVQLTGFRIVRINIIGEVHKPGIYYAPAIWRISEIIDMAGGFTDRADIRRITIKGLGKQKMADLVRFNALGDPLDNPLVCIGDVISVPSISSATGFVSVTGLVNHPGTYTYIERDNLDNLITYSGGHPGSLGDMDIIVSSTDDNRSNRMSGGDPNVGEWKPEPGENIKLIWKENRPNYGMVDIFGAVVYPGRYKITSNSFTLADLFQICGGADAKGCPEMIQVFRRNKSFSNIGADLFVDQQNSETVSTGTMTKRSRISLNPRESQQLMLLELVDEDSLYIPYATGMVMVSGAVASPGLVKFEQSKNIDYYIDQAGGYGYDADRERTVVINPYTGGRVSHNNVARLFDGEIVFVPQKNNKERQ